MQKLIEVNNLSVRCDNYRYLLRSVFLEIHAGETWALMGPSGSGKTTLALAIMGLLSIDLRQEGEVSLLGHNLKNLNEVERSKLRKKGVAMVFQDPSVSLNPFFTIGFQLQETVGKNSKLSKKERREYARRVLEEVGFSNPLDLMKRYAHELSGGEKQRALIAMALIQEPQVLIADEPTASLDFILKIEILQLLQRIQEKRGLALILITHDPRIAFKMASKVWVIEDKKLSVRDRAVSLKC